MTITSGANTAITFDISSLATSSTFLGGRECTQIDFGTLGFDDYIINVDPITGHATTAPVVGQSINLYAWGADTSLATIPIDVLDGVDSAETLTHAAIRDSLILVASTAVTVATAALTYYIAPFSVRRVFGGPPPKFGGFFIAHSHAGALAAAQSALFSYNTITYS